MFNPSTDKFTILKSLIKQINSKVKKFQQQEKIHPVRGKCNCSEESQADYQWLEKETQKSNNKENLMFNWLKNRVKEMSSWSGASLIALGVLIILGGPFVKLAAWAAIAWGAWSIWHKEVDTI